MKSVSLARDRSGSILRWRNLENVLATTEEISVKNGLDPDG